jgi:hypothetical protein
VRARAAPPAELVPEGAPLAGDEVAEAAQRAVVRVELQQGDTACYVILKKADGGDANYPGSFELCAGGGQDATGLVGKAVTLDIGDPKDAHPDNKVHVGHRLAIAGRKVVYGEDLVYFGPTYVSHEIRDGKAYVTDTHTGGGLIIGQAPWRAKSMPEVPTDRLVGFALAGVDGKWHAAGAVIDGDTVVVSSPSVPTPTSVAYGWADSPSVNLYNKENLPAAPFRVDQ